MYKSDYSNKMSKLLEDKNIYKTIRTDPTPKLQKTNNTLVNEIFKNKYIDQWQKNKMYSSSSTAPRLYGLPKIHKPDLPLRPISSSTNVPCYQLSKHIGQILKNIVNENYNINNSIQLKTQLEVIVLEEDDFLVSFDAVSLFTNIPTYLAIKIIMKKWDIIKNFTKIPKAQFLKILEFCLKENNYFKYDNKLYNQTFGMPMGNPLSPTIADIILDDLLDKTIEELKTEKQITIKFIKKYVDDVFAIIKEKDKDAILEFLNHYHTKLKFTVETEQNKSLPYLDIRIFRTINKIKFNWYSKTTASGRMINFLSTQPLQQKINTANNFINKIIQISDIEFKEENIKTIKTILHMNNFPNYLINNLINKTINKTNQNKNSQQNPDVGNTVRYYGISYIPNLTDKRNLNKIINKENVTFAHKSNTTIKQLFTNTKSKIEKEQQHDIIYKIGCSGKEGESCNLIYIGTTKRSLETRLIEHKADIRNKRESTGLSQHIIETGHSADFDNTTIMDKEKRTNKRYKLESLRIQHNIEKTMNTQEDRDKTIASYSLALRAL
ncbi:uncharacterized protein LOC129919958 [Episyrphus balteatus]|uniref:uncharacterized protein LOC129919958 n=1 Tax=Episyrphus balteatus TaxID=286459 RepID=UPI0024869851|nr:uncharacterized protein LOC129919958 [Episyrphus balteatus]